jgi:hypothetical protein
MPRYIKLCMLSEWPIKIKYDFILFWLFTSVICERSNLLSIQDISFVSF